MFDNSRLDGYMEAKSWDFASLNGQCLTVPCLRCRKNRVLQNALHAMESGQVPCKHAFSGWDLKSAGRKSGTTNVR